nr:MAG TPA: hypothetical protein [Caudoviricetes sp.]
MVSPARKERVFVNHAHNKPTATRISAYNTF